MKSNREILIYKLENLSLLDGRYESLRCVNFSGPGNEKRGNFSLVFQATDRLENKPVAIKFFDPDPAIMVDKYRRDAFEREPHILRALLGQKRCLQLVAGLKTFNLEIQVPGNGGTVTLPCQYFVIDWVPLEIDAYFERQHEGGTEDKLRLFNEIVLAVQVLHQHEISHRDIKVDNLRAYEEALKRIVVAIDLGTAAQFDSAQIGFVSQYFKPVGHFKYSAPETWCGLAGERRVAPYTDVYALGCLLYELFNQDLFDVHVQKDINYKMALAALSLDLAQHDSLEKKLHAWEAGIYALRPSMTPIPATTEGHSVPPAIQLQLNDLLYQLTAFDFRQRLLDLQLVRNKVWSMIRVLRNNKAQQHAIAMKRLNRQRKEEKIRRRERRLSEYLLRARQMLC